MKVHVDANVCAGFGVCVGLCPEVFELHDDGYAIVRVTEVPPEFEDTVQLAVSHCPARAISVSEDASKPDGDVTL
jgi:ferredoxin